MKPYQRFRIGTPLRDDGLAILTYKDRFEHCYILGRTRSGKSTFMTNLIVHDLDDCCIVLDPVGGFADSVCALAPKDKLIRIDHKHPIVINPLDRDLDWDIIAIEMAEVMDACVGATTSSPDATILMKDLILHTLRVFNKKGEDLNVEKLANFLNFEGVRAKYKPDEFWDFIDERRGYVYTHKEKVDSTKRIGSRLSPFYVSPTLRKFTIGKDQFNVKSFVENKNIVVVNLNRFSTDGKAYIGNLVSHAVKSYYHFQAEETSPPLYFYIDEFHSFISPFFSEMLSQSGKFNISVNLAHQNHEQIDKKTLSSVLGNCNTMAIYSCGYDEATKLAGYMGIKSTELTNLGRFQSMVRIRNKNHLVKMSPPPKIPEYQPVDSTPTPVDSTPVKPSYYFLSDNAWMPV